jgi:cysteinyl-tRNA synthetase
MEGAGMKIYNTASRQVEEFEPINDGRVKLYTCGPTVYDYAQIGNLRAFVFDDTLRRVLSASGYDVKHVMNITDVGHLVSDEDEGEDKLEKGAARENKSVWQVAEFFIEAFLSDVKSLNILEPNGYDGPHGVYARATDFIDQQIDLVKILVDKAFAYQTEQAIYFDVSKLSDYGKLTRQKLSDKEVAARADVITDAQKRHPQDFAVWFFSVGRFANHSMRWPSPWGEGFPGWHLECSAIIHATLGEPIDIHTGGVDHIGTHHTNEIAQTEAAYDIQLANYWMHNEHLLIDGRKMSKSMGNFIKLSDITERGIDPLALRLLFLQSHYRSQTNFTWQSLEAAQITLKNFYAWADLQFQGFESIQLREDYGLSFAKILSSMQDDLASPEALGWFNGMVNRTDSLGIDSLSIGDQAKKIDELFGLGLSTRKDVPDDIKSLIKDRDEAREAKDWKKADSIRDKLLEHKIEINDSAAGSVWRRV